MIFNWLSNSLKIYLKITNKSKCQNSDYYNLSTVQLIVGRCLAVQNSESHYLFFMKTSSEIVDDRDNEQNYISFIFNR